MAVRYMREREPTPTFTNLRRAAAPVAMAERPTAATPAVLNMARRSIVRSLIYMSPTKAGVRWLEANDTANSLKSDQSEHAATINSRHRLRRHDSTASLNHLRCLRLLVVARFAAAAPIDRHALVTRHNPTITAVDKSAPFMVGNGNLAFTADITGLQTFPEQYSTLVPLMTQAQWAWHSFPNPKGFTLAQAEVPIKVRGKTQKYPYLSDWEQAKRPEVQWLRENPHRFSLGRLGLYLANTGGKPAAFSDLSATRQTLDMWTGRLSSSFVFDGVPVEVETSVHPDRDLIIVRLRSNLLADGRLGVDLRFPGVSAKLNPDPADWHTSRNAYDHGDVAQRRWPHARAPARRHPLHGAGGVGSRARHRPIPRRTRTGSRRPVPCSSPC